MKYPNDDEFIFSTLLDIGFSNEEIDKLLKNSIENNKKINKTLIAYRGELLDSICINQEKLYRLDYLMQKLRKKQGGN